MKNIKRENYDITLYRMYQAHVLRASWFSKRLGHSIALRHRSVMQYHTAMRCDVATQKFHQTKSH